MPNISGIKGNQTMKFGELLEFNRFFLKNNAENEAGTIVPDLFLFFKKAPYTEWSTACFRYISLAFKLEYSKNKLYKTWDYWSRDILYFDFSEKCLGIVFPPRFAYYFSTKIFLMLHSVNWQNLIVWLHLLLEIFR